MLILVVTIAELVTLLDVTGLIGWHVGIGLVLTSLALLKTSSTGWRVLRYYLGAPDYVAAGPPPMLLRLLGPVLVFATLGVLGSGIALIVIGRQSTHRTWISLLGQGISPLTIHQGFFILFAVVISVHVAARLFPAILLVSGRDERHRQRAAVPGGRPRAAALVASVLAGAIAVLLLVPAFSWHDKDHDHDLAATVQLR